MEDDHQLQRFLNAQASTFETACAELKAGRKSTHWMWFVFPQIKGLGHSPAAKLYAINSRREAEAYLAHPILGQRLIEATACALTSETRSLREIFGSPDDMKFASCMTLFEAVAPSHETIFTRALDRLCGGVRDNRTLEILRTV